MRLMGFIGSSGSGKTTLVEQLVPILKQDGLRISAIKHTHHGFDLDRPGKDSYRYRAAGAEEVMLVAGSRWALLREAAEEELELPALLKRMAPADLILVEGFKLAEIPKIEIYRPSLGKPPFYPHDPNILAIASDAAPDIGTRALLPLNAPDEIARFVRAHAAEWR